MAAIPVLVELVDGPVLVALMELLLHVDWVVCHAKH
jgi:hypothetical protein